MKGLRLALLSVILLALTRGMASDAHATDPISCWKYCSGHFYSGQCWASLEDCCQINQSTCPDPWEFDRGDCSDGQNTCP
jgi:hypothetical protein